MKTSDEALSHVEILPYDSNWPLLYRAEDRLLRVCLGSLVREIEHIGSTAIPGLQAKPIIDIMASSDEALKMTDFAEKLTLIGYAFVQTGMRNRLMFRKSDEESGQIYHLHIVGAASWTGRKERMMRDCLLGHPADAVAYGRLREALAKSFARDSLAYTKAKTDFIQDLTNKASDSLGVARTNVWVDGCILDDEKWR